MTKYGRAIFKYMMEVLGIDSEREDIGWYPDSDKSNHYIMRFEVNNEEYTLGYNKREERVERLS